MRVAVLALVMACHSPATVPLDTGDACGVACAKLTDAGCAEAKATPAGESCGSFCARNQSALPVSCVLNASSVDYLRLCGVCR